MGPYTTVKYSALVALLILTSIPRALVAQSTDISTEYLMTLHAPLDAPLTIDESLIIYNVLDGGWVKGPKIEGKLRAPGGDWLQLLSDGTLRIDVRLTIETDDGALIYLSYNGVARRTGESMAKRARGEIVGPDDMYFITAPTMRTSSERYDWLNHVQCIGKMVQSKSGEGAHVKYDVFVVH